MFLLSLIVFINLFLIPIVFHPITVCRHLIHIGHEPFHPEDLKDNSLESFLIARFERLTKKKSWWNFFPRSNRKSFYPNLIDYSRMFLRDYSWKPFVHSFIFMYISYFLLTFVSSLVHVYRLTSKRRETSREQIRTRAQQMIDASYLRWIFNSLSWKFFGVLSSHLFHVLAVKILMQNIFLSYEHFHLEDSNIYSCWNVKKNLQLIFQYEGWTIFLNGLFTRTIYELGITLLPRLIWWPIRSLLFSSTIDSYFRASAVELYFLQCLAENLCRAFSTYLQIFARLTTLDIVNHMHEQINRKKYPLLFFLRHRADQPWFLPVSIDLLDAQLITRCLSVFFRQVN